MTNGRELLTDALTAPGLPAWQVVSDPRQLDGVRQPGAVVLWTGVRRRLELQSLTMLSDELNVWCLTPTNKPEAIEPGLDALLLDVLQVIEGQPELSWDTAERGVLADTYDGWRVVVTCAYVLTETERLNP